MRGEPAQDGQRALRSLGDDDAAHSWRARRPGERSLTGRPPASGVGVLRMAEPRRTPTASPAAAARAVARRAQYAARAARPAARLARVQLFGEVLGLQVGRAKVYFELRDGAGALPCSMWRNDLDALGLDGARPTARSRGGRRRLDYYPGSRASSPSFSFARHASCAWRARATCSPRSSGCAARSPPRGCSSRRSGCRARRCRARSASSPARAARRATTCSPACAAAAGPGALVWAFAPVQDRHAAPAITRALQDLAACEEVEVIVVARGGGSLADLFAFCDETLCRTVALLRVPVIASVGHHTDRTLIDDVAAVACSTPTHAAEAAVPVDCAAARAALRGLAARLEQRSRLAIVERARALARLSRAPADHVARHRARLHQHAARAARERAAAGCEPRGPPHVDHRARARAQGARGGAAPSSAQRARDLERLALALAAHEPAARARARLRAGRGPRRRAGHLARPPRASTPS